MNLQSVDVLLVSSNLLVVMGLYKIIGTNHCQIPFHILPFPLQWTVYMKTEQKSCPFIIFIMWLLNLDELLKYY